MLRVGSGSRGLGRLAKVRGTQVWRGRHAGYYCPTPATSEVYRARAEILPDADRKRRILFVSEFSNQILSDKPSTDRFSASGYALSPHPL